MAVAGAVTFDFRAIVSSSAGKQTGKLMTMRGNCIGTEGERRVGICHCSPEREGGRCRSVFTRHGVPQVPGLTGQTDFMADEYNLYEIMSPN